MNHPRFMELIAFRTKFLTFYELKETGSNLFPSLGILFHAAFVI